MFIRHPFEPIYDKYSEILILGTIPSPKSRENGFYYCHPQNRFWKVLAGVFQSELPVTIEDKIDFLLKNKVAVWDVLASCEIEGADDNSIKAPVVNDFVALIRGSNINRIYTTGNTAYNLYEKFCYNSTGIHAIKLLSPSPANCRCSLDDLIENYRSFLKHIF